MKIQKFIFTAFSWYRYQRHYFHGLFEGHENKFQFDSRHFNGVNNFYSIFMVHKEYEVSTMNFVNAVFIARKIKINIFSGLFHDFFPKAGFIVIARICFVCFPNKCAMTFLLQGRWQNPDLIGLDWTRPLLETWTYFRHKVDNVTFHIRPIKSFPGQLYHTWCT